MNIKWIRPVVSLSMFAVALASTAVAQPTPPSHHAPHSTEMTTDRPESVGFSSERLQRLHSVMQQAVDKKEVAGVVTLLARHGKIVDYRAYGQRDMASGAPMTKDTIFRDYSMTKPVTGVAMMILFEEGKWLPNDPIAKYIPQFAHLKVFNGVDAVGKMILVDPDHAPTMHELMSHTAGFTYGFFGNTPVDKMVRDAQVFQGKNLQEMIDKLAKIPLLYQPGKGWTYSLSMDIEGYIVEKLSGQSLPDFMRDRIYAPLGMKDAGFYVPAEKRSRFATNYWWDPDTNTVSAKPRGFVSPHEYEEPPVEPSGGGGMVSTIEDYYRFARMLANGGELEGKRLLSPATVKLMTTNHVPVPLLTQGFGIGLQQIRPGFGYGYNCAVEYDPEEANLPDGKGTFLWDGAAGTWFWVDPTNDIVFVGMIQRMNGGSPNLQYLSRSIVYGALVDPSK
ncbi:MAG TPA: serine hydrolase domain-containing protein [Terracidiphilus sp.]|jgi:CubicO group peptidase (beta-lactamase class C family)|nr:serine hydrolase domain-containing protein [Terracidiphilus sp.]